MFFMFKILICHKAVELENPIKHQTKSLLDPFKVNTGTWSRQPGNGYETDNVIERKKEN